MRLRWVESAVVVDTTEDLLTLHRVGFNTFFAKEMPTEIAFPMAARIVGEPDDFTNFSIGVSVAGPNGDGVDEFEFPLSADPTGWDQGRIGPSVVVPLPAIGIRADSPGLYTVNVRVNGGDPWALPLMVVDQSGDDAGP